MLTWLPATSTAAIRPPAVAGSFYPRDPGELARLVDRLLVAADARAPVAGPDAPLAERPLAGLLIPHAGLIYSGVVAAAGWRLIGQAWPDDPLTVVLLGTDHAASWLRGVAVWETGAWRTPLGDVTVDARVAEQILDIGPPFIIDRAAHIGEHSLEVQLPLLQTVGRRTRIVPLSVAAGTDEAAITAGRRLGELLARSRAAGEPVILAISSDMAHYPPSQECTRATTDLLPSIVGLQPESLALAEQALVAKGGRGLVCGMCGIQPTVLGLAALRAAGVTRGRLLAAATSTDAGGPADRSVGYLAVAFTG